MVLLPRVPMAMDAGAIGFTLVSTMRLFRQTANSDWEARFKGLDGVED